MSPDNSSGSEKIRGPADFNMCRKKRAYNTIHTDSKDTTKQSSLESPLRPAGSKVDKSVGHYQSSANSDIVCDIPSTNHGKYERTRPW